MENYLNISVILPIKNNKEKDFVEFFGKSIESLQIQEVQPKELVIVHTGDETLVEFLNSYDFKELNVKVLKYEGESNFGSQVNFGIENSSSEWVSILEFDDEFSKIWFKNVKKYSDVYTDVDAFLPIVVDVDDKLVFAGFTNEATFANNFSQESGILTNDTLHQYQNFQISGMVIKKSSFEEFGGFPEKTVTSEDYFLSRMYNPKKFKIVSHYFGQDSRRFKKMGYFGMATYLIKNFINRNNKVYWDNLDSSKYWN